MIRNHFKIALRNILHHKGNAVINIVGLAAGITACLLIYMFVSNELSYDRFNSNAKNMYRLVFDYKFPDKLDHLSVAAPVAGITVKKDFPEVVGQTCLAQYSGKLMVKAGEKKFYEDKIFMADSNFFNLFDYKLLAGYKSTVLKDPNTVAIDEASAKKYFGKEDPIGKTLQYDNGDGTFASYKVSGVFENVPSNSHMVFTALVSYKTFEVQFGPQALNNWHNAGSYVYLQLKDHTDPAAFEKKIEHLYDKYAAQYQNIKASISMHLEPLTDIHLHSDRLFDVAVKGNPSYIYIFSAVAAFLLLIACINYINLATAQGKVRMKELGVRKVIGAGRGQLIGQLLSESAVIVLISIVVSQLLLFLFLPAFNYMAGLELGPRDIYTLKNCIFISLSALCIILLSGIYPAFYLTSFSPALAIKSNSTSGEKGVTLRKTLVVAQFCISIILITATLIVRSQVNYMLSHDPGFNKNNIIAIRLQDTIVVSSYPALKNDLLQLKGVAQVSQTSTLPGDAPDRKITQVESSTDGVINEIPVEPIWVDPDYFELMQIHLKEGRWFDTQHGLDTRESFVVNEAASKKFNWKKNIGKKIIWGRGPRKREGQVIGVTRDIYTGSLKNEIEPIVFICDKNPGKAYAAGYLLVRMKPGDREQTVKAVCDVFSGFDKLHPVDYKFLDDNLSGLYTGEQRTNLLFQYLSLLTILIACLGLFGLVSFSVAQRVKEIGVRKVLGASVTGIAALLSKDFIKLVLLAFVIAVPISWYAMHKWLQDFAFRTEIHSWPFIAAGCIAVLIALITVSAQAVKAALVNPVKSLRTE